MGLSKLMGFFITGICLSGIIGYFGLYLHKWGNKWISTSFVALVALLFGIIMMLLRKLGGLEFRDVTWMVLLFSLLGYISIYFFLFFDSPAYGKMSFWSYMQRMARAKMIIKQYDGPEDHLKEYLEETLFAQSQLKLPEAESSAFETWFVLFWNGLIYTLILVGVVSFNSLGALLRYFFTGDEWITWLVVIAIMLLVPIYMAYKETTKKR